MINVRALEEQLTAEDVALRATLDGLIASAAPGEEPTALLRIATEGFVALHERQHTLTLLIARLP